MWLEDLGNVHSSHIQFFNFGGHVKSVRMTVWSEIFRTCRTTIPYHHWKFQICIPFTVVIMNFKWAKLGMWTMHVSQIWSQICLYMRSYPLVHVHQLYLSLTFDSNMICIGYITIWVWHDILIIIWRPRQNQRMSVKS